ncbi:MAG: hypothetical protein H0W19_04065 [Nitrosopumilus sp.]|nr:hypothetical protein [Nitrosopumilus sp.]
MSSCDSYRVWISIQSLLIASGNISKILCPDEKYPQRELRKRLSIKGNESFSSRAARNYLEHVDKRL